MADEIVLVTGSGSGIGLASVDRLLEAGWRVAAADRDGAALDRLKDERPKSEERLQTFTLDVTDEAQVQSVVDRIGSEFGAIRGVVNSAGIGRDARFFETGAQLFRDIYEINVIGSFLVAKAAGAAMRKSAGGAGGSIVNISSVSGLKGNIGRSAYGASKGALVSLTKIMAVELAPEGIRVNAIAPGPIDTPMVVEVHTDEIRAGWNATVPMRRYGRPEEIAGAAAFLLDERATSYLTGQVIAVDGGFTAGGIIA